MSVDESADKLLSLFTLFTHTMATDGGTMKKEKGLAHQQSGVDIPTKVQMSGNPSRGLGLGLRLHQVTSLSRGPFEPFLTASYGSGYPGSAWLGLRLQAELFTSLGTSPNIVIISNSARNVCRMSPLSPL